MNNFTPTIHRCLPHDAPGKIRRLDLITAAGGALLFTLLIFFFTPVNETAAVQQYFQFAQNPFSFTSYPYGARMATPVLAGLLPFDVQTGFRILSFISFFLCGVFLDLLLRMAGVSLRWRLALLPAFYFASTARFIVANPCYVDPMSYWLMTAAFLGILSGNYGLTMFFLALGALNRPESLTLVLILIPTWWSKERPLRSLLAAALCALPAILLASAMRFIWPWVSDYQIWKEITRVAMNINPQPYAEIFAQQGFSALIDPSVYREALPCLWGLAALGFLQTTWRIRWAALAHIILAISPMMIATDYFRLPFYAFPAVIFLSGLGLQTLHRIHVYYAAAAAAAVLLLTLLFPQSITAGIILAIAVCALYRLNRTETNSRPA
ncbi:MAG: hypothetical protein JXR73_02900 [Candidatus Omnitrophica bacterium]|nr:hypothetical protein [Candidatus Omnitrophota bacterium]